ncbi:MAG: flagellar basal-body MS-ring/collar protein FliF, partial [Acidobacteriaceae bacterium]
MAETPGQAGQAGQARAAVTALTVEQRAGALVTGAVARYRGMEPPRRTRLLAAALLVVGCFAGLMWYGSRPDWRTLYAGLAADDARQIAQQLTTAGIPFDVSPDGTTLRVPAQNLDKARLATTAKGAPRSGRMGFELFDQPNWMGSEFDEKVNYQRALEGELERTIGTLAEVESARVHLVLPHDSLFSDEQREAKASVVLRLRHRTLAEEDAEGIRNLVAGAVDELRPENVALVDAEGGALLGRKSGDAALEAREQQLEEKLVATLEPVAGAGNVRASVTIAYDPDSADELDENYDPAQTAPLSMESREQTNGPAAGASGVPGTTSNGGSAGAAKPPLYPPAAGTGENLKEQSATYGVSKKTRHMVEPAGRVDRVTAAVLINDQRVEQGKQTQWKPRGAAEMQQLSALAQAAIGFDAGRGDQVNVEELAFDDNGAPPVPSLEDRALKIAGQSQGILHYGVILAAMLAFFLLVARPALRWLATAPPAGRTG